MLTLREVARVRLFHRRLSHRRLSHTGRRSSHRGHLGEAIIVHFTLLSSLNSSNRKNGTCVVLTGCHDLIHQTSYASFFSPFRCANDVALLKVTWRSSKDLADGARHLRIPPAR